MGVNLKTNGSLAMPNRFSLILVFLVPLGLGSCVVAPPEPESTYPYPYGQPRYGHGGTQAPPPAGAPTAGNPNNSPYGPPGGQNVPGAPPNQTGGLAGAPNAGNPAGGPNAGPGAGSTGPNSGAGSSGGSSSEPPPYGIPVPGKNGMIYSPYKPDAGFIDITTRNADGSSAVLPPGTKIKDPFSGKPILVP